MTAKCVVCSNEEVEPIENEGTDQGLVQMRAAVQFTAGQR